MSQILLHTKTAHSIANILAHPPHALLIVGRQGIGRSYIANYIADQLVPLTSMGQAQHMSIRGDSGAISIQNVRELQRFLRLKTTGAGQIRRVALLTDADAMTHEAQNALLKSLEEPPSDTLIIMTVERQQSLLSTVCSRMQICMIYPPTELDTISYFDQYAAADVRQAYQLSSGAVGTIHHMLTDESDNQLTQSVTQAKQLLTCTPYERLMQVDIFSKDKLACESLLFALRRICTVALESAAQKQDKTQVHAWHTRLSLVARTEKQLTQSANTKLMLTNLFVNL